MKFDYSSRLMAAFGFVASSAAGYGMNKVAEIIRGDELNGNGAYIFNKNAKFDEITLRSTLDSGEYKFAFGSILNENESGDIFATPPMLSLKRAKRLIVTSIDRSDFEVVERYNTEPYEISMRGLLIDMQNHEFPISKMETLNKIFEQNGVWDVDSEILQALGVHSIYLKDIGFEFVEGYEDTVAYTFTAHSIRPLEYQLINN